MYMFWSDLIEPLLKIIKAKKIVEIGSDYGYNTKNILQYCVEHDAELICVDPFPKYEPCELNAKYQNRMTLYKELSLNVLGLIHDYDVIFLDGDHNWYTVYNELKLIERNFKTKEKFPLVLLHDVSWPYDRRDLYYNPANIPDAYRHPYEKKGILPNEISLVEREKGCINSHLNNSIYVNNLKNGVLTALEDFLKESYLELNFIDFKVMYGIGVVFTEDVTISKFLESSDLCIKIMEIAERFRIEGLVKIEKQKLDIETCRQKRIKLESSTSETIKQLKDEKARQEAVSNEKIARLTDELEVHRQKLEEQKQKFNQEICNYKTELNAQKSFRAELTREIKHIENSIRYRAGESLISAAKPSIDTLKLPLRLIRLLLESKKKAPHKSITPVVIKQSEEYTKKCKKNTDLDTGLHRTFDESCDKTLKALDRKISVIIPVYNAYEDTKHCIESVLNNTNIDFELVIIDDCSPDPMISKLLNKYVDHKNIKIIRNDENMGFVKTVNRGFRETSGDVILLNSDTVVTERWALKLLVSAYSDDKIATVTPFSNSAGVFSVPKSGTSPIPSHLSLEKMAQLVENVSKMKYITVPTGHGFCMFIKRDAILDVGLFDEDSFSKGYGEENDFCMRAGYKGWKHIVNDSVYVFHSNGSSFGSERKQKLIAENRIKLNKLHPTYTSLVEQLKKSDELRDMRTAINTAIEQALEDVHKDKKNILYVLHVASGGTPQTNKDLMRHIQHEYNCYVLTSCGKSVELWQYEDGLMRSIHSVAITKWNICKFEVPEFQKIYFDVLVNLHISIVHIRHLISHSLDLPQIAHLMGIPVVLSFHDFYFACPSVYLVNGDNVYCAGKCKSKLACKSPYGWISDDVTDVRMFVDKWRDGIKSVISNCNAFVTTSPYVKDILCDAHPSLKNRDFRVIEHGRDFEQVNTDGLSEEPKPGEKIKILILGNISNYKGGDFIRKIKKLDFDDKLEFHFLGALQRQYKDAGIGIEHGIYAREDLCSILESIKPSFAGIFSIWPETYCHTLTEVWAFGIPPFVSDIGVLRERTIKHDAGWLINFNTPEIAYKQILDIASNISEYKRVKENIKKIEIRTTEEMAGEYKSIYSDLLDRKN